MLTAQDHAAKIGGNIEGSFIHNYGKDANGRGNEIMKHESMKL